MITAKIFLFFLTCVNPETHSGSGSTTVLAGYSHSIVDDGDICGWSVQQTLLEAGAGHGGGHGPAGASVLGEGESLGQL